MSDTNQLLIEQAKPRLPGKLADEVQAGIDNPALSPEAENLLAEMDQIKQLTNG